MGDRSMDMNFALENARQNRRRIMDRFMAAFSSAKDKKKY